MKTFSASQQTLVDATSKTVSWLFEVNNQYLNFDAYAGTRKFKPGDSIVGATSGATATIERVVWTSSTSGKHMLSGVSGTFQDDEVIYVASYGSELLTNGDMELDANWADFGSVTSNTQSDEQAHGGTYSRKIVDDAVLGGGCQQYIAEILSPGDFFKMDGWVYIDTLNSNAIVLESRQYGGVSLLSLQTSITGSFQNLTGIGHLPSGEAWGGILTFGSSVTGVSTWYLDDVSLKKIKTAALANGTVQGNTYYWSFKDYDYGDTLYFGADAITFGADSLTFGSPQSYTFKIIKDSFNGVSLSSPINHYGTYAPNTIEFAITNGDSALAAGDFVDSSVLVSLVIGSGETSEVLRQFKFITKTADPVYKTIEFYCEDFVASYMEGDYPKTPFVNDLFTQYSSSTEPKDSEPFCVPVIFGTAYIPLQVVSDSAYNKGYLLGPDDYTYTISEVTSPRYFGASMVWESTDADFRQDTLTDRFSQSRDWKIFYPYLAKMNANSYTGTHDGGDGQSTLTDSTKSWTNDELIGMRIVNETDGSSGYITDNTGTTVTATLSGGTQNDWDDDEVYHIEATGIWVANDEFQNLLVKLARSDLSSTTDPADVIEYVLEDIGIQSGNIDTATSFASASTTYSSWGLSFNGAYYYKQSITKVISQLLNQCHSTLDIDSTVELRVLSKTSQKTLTDADILKGTFSKSFITKSEYDSGRVTFLESGEPQDVYQKLIAPCKGSFENPSSDILELPFIADSQISQVLGMLKYQREYLPEANETFSTKATCLALQPNDVITLNATIYGGSHDVLIENMHINLDASIDFSCVRFSQTLDDFDDLSPSAITPSTDNNTTIWKPIIAGPDNIIAGSGTYVHLLPGHLRVGDTSSYIYIDSDYPYVSVLASDAEKVRLGNLNGFLDFITDLYGIAMGESGKSLSYDPTNGLVLTGPGIEVGTSGYFRSAGKDSYADTTAGIWIGYDTDAYKINIGDDTSYITWDGSTLTITGGLSANSVEVGTTGYVRTVGKTSYADTDAGFWLGYDDPNYKLYLGDATTYVKWDGSTLSIKGNITITGGSGIGNLADAGPLVDATDLDDIPNGSSYGKVALTSISAGKILVAGLDSGVTDRIFADGTTKTNIEGWKHASDATLIDGGDIYTNSITADAISVTSLSAINADMGSITSGDITLDSSGFICTTGKTTYADTDAGFWLGYDSGAYKLNIGNGSYSLKWTGAALEVDGEIINTGNLVDNAATIVGTYYLATTEVNVTGAGTVVGSVNYTSVGSPLHVVGSVVIDEIGADVDYVYVYIKDGSTTKYTSSVPVSAGNDFQWTATVGWTPSSGSRTINLVVGTGGTGADPYVDVSQRSIIVQETKK